MNTPKQYPTGLAQAQWVAPLLPKPKYGEQDGRPPHRDGLKEGIKRRPAPTGSACVKWGGWGYREEGTKTMTDF